MSRRGHWAARSLTLVLAVPAIGLLSACGADSAADGSDEVAVDQTVTALLQGDDQLGATASLIGQTGLAPLLDAAPSYTLLAPTDAAMEALPEASGTDDRATDTAANAAILRAHLLPGYVTLDDITAAIAGSESHSVTMQTMAQTPLTFTMDGDAVKVTAADGASGKLVGSGLSGGNGVVLPVDAVLKAL